MNPNRIVDSEVGKTDAGRILLLADLQLKTDIDKLTDPRVSQRGQQFWQDVDKNIPAGLLFRSRLDRARSSKRCIGKSKDRPLESLRPPKQRNARASGIEATELRAAPGLPDIF